MVGLALQVEDNELSEGSTCNLSVPTTLLSLWALNKTTSLIFITVHYAPPKVDASNYLKGH